MSEPVDPMRPGPGRAPAPLVVAAGLTGIQGFFTVLFAIAEIAATSRDRLVMGGSTALFFAIYGAALIGGAWGLYRCRTWARGPVFMTQLIWLGLAWNFRSVDQSGLVVLAIVVAVSAVIVMAGLVHPASTDALARENPEV